MSSSLPWPHASRSAFAEGQTRIQDWASDGIVAALMENNRQAVWAETLLLPTSPSLLARLPLQRQNDVIDTMLARLGNVDPGVRGAAIKALSGVADATRERRSETLRKCSLALMTTTRMFVVSPRRR